MAEHELVGPGVASILDEHYDRHRPAPSGGPRPKTSAEKRFCALSEEAPEFLVGAAAVGNPRLAQRLHILLGLGAGHSSAVLVSARRRAVTVRRFRVTDVRSILAAGTGTHSPCPAGDALILDPPSASVRSLDAYKATTTDRTAS